MTLAPTQTTVADPAAVPGTPPAASRAASVRRPPIDLDFVVDVARTWRRELIGAALAGLVLGVAVTMLAPSSYTGFAVVRVDPFVVDELGQVGRNSTGNTAGLEAEARSDTVMDLAGSMLEPAVSGGELRPTVQAVRVGTGNVVELEATASSAERAADKANAVAQAFLEVRRTTIEAELAASIATLDEQIAQAETELTALRVGGDAGAEASVQVTSLEERLQSLNALRVRADLYSALPGEVLRAAVAPEQGDGASPVLMGLAFAVLAATGVLAFGVSRQRPLVTVADVAALAGPVVATLRTGDGDESSYILGVRRIDAWLRVRGSMRPLFVSGGRANEASVVVSDLVRHRGANQAVRVVDLERAGLKAVIQGPGAMQICGPEVLRNQQPGEQIPIAAPASEHPQTLHAAGASDVAILVVDAAATSFEELQGEVEQFEGIGVQLAGSILIQRGN